MAQIITFSTMAAAAASRDAGRAPEAPCTGSFIIAKPVPRGREMLANYSSRVPSCGRLFTRYLVAKEIVGLGHLLQG